MPTWLEFALQTLTLAFMLIGLFGLVVPVFPGLVVIWLASLVYLFFENLAGQVTTLGWVIFSVMAVLMLVGNVLDNIIIARKMREHTIPWGVIGIAFLAGILVSLLLTPLVGIVASPLALFLAELYRLKDRAKAWASTKAWLVGFGWSFLARFGIGVVMIGLWLFWAWSQPHF